MLHPQSHRHKEKSESPGSTSVGLVLTVSRTLCYPGVISPDSVESKESLQERGIGRDPPEAR